MANSTSSRGVHSVRVIAVLCSLGAIYLGRDLLVPTALAVLVAFLLLPIVRWLMRHRFTKGIAVLITVGIASLVAIAIGWVVINQAADLATQLPKYRENLGAKAYSITSSAERTISKVTGAIGQFKQDFAATRATTQASTGGGIAPSPQTMRVEVVSNGSDLAETIASVLAAPIFLILGEFAVTALLLIFIMLHSEDIRERLIWIAGMRQMTMTTTALDEAAGRIGKYLRMLLIVNLSYGTLIALGLQMIGVPGAFFWGATGAMLRFMPFIGPWLSASMPTLLSVAVFSGWGRPLAVIGLFAGVEALANALIEPWLYGSSTGISSIGVVCAMVFWAWIWGPVGLVLAVPITVCLVVLGKYVPQLAVFHQMFGSDEAVPEVARLYQRLLIHDERAAGHIIQDHMQRQPFTQACDELLLPVLCELQRDRSGGLIDRDQVRNVTQLVDALCHPDISPAAAEAVPRVLFVPAFSDIDEEAARLLERCARTQCIPGEAMTSHALTSEIISHASEAPISAICIVQTGARTSAHTRHLVKMLAGQAETTIRLLELCMDATTPARSSEKPNAQIRREQTAAGLLERLHDLRINITPAPEPAVAAGTK